MKKTKNLEQLQRHLSHYRRMLYQVRPRAKHLIRFHIGKLKRLIEQAKTPPPSADNACN